MRRPTKSYLQEKMWEEKAKENPLYGVMSHEEFAESGAEPSNQELDVFYSRGDEMVAQWINPWLLETNVTDDMCILEFGCGMGRLTGSLAENQPLQNVYGIDISPTMIMHAKKNTNSSINYSTIDDTGDLPYESDMFDRVYSYAVFQHIAERSVVERSIREIARVLKPGGNVKLNFEMIFPPPFENPLKQDTFALENSYLVYGWKKILGVPVWGIKRNYSNNWGGIRLGYRQLLRVFTECGLKIHGLIREPHTRGQTWFLGVKLP